MQASAIKNPSFNYLQFSLLLNPSDNKRGVPTTYWINVLQDSWKMLELSTTSMENSAVLFERGNETKL